MNMADNIYELFETLPKISEPMYCPVGGTTYLFTWEDDSRKNDWRADGYKWPLNGTFKNVKSDLYIHNHITKSSDLHIYYHNNSKNKQQISALFDSRNLPILPQKIPQCLFPQFTRCDFCTSAIPHYTRAPSETIPFINLFQSSQTDTQSLTFVKSIGLLSQIEWIFVSRGSFRTHPKNFYRYVI